MVEIDAPSPGRIVVLHFGEQYRQNTGKQTAVGIITHVEFDEKEYPVCTVAVGVYGFLGQVSLVVRHRFDPTRADDTSYWDYPPRITKKIMFPEKKEG